MLVKTFGSAKFILIFYAESIQNSHRNFKFHFRETLNRVIQILFLVDGDGTMVSFGVIIITLYQMSRKIEGTEYLVNRHGLYFLISCGIDTKAN